MLRIPASLLAFIGSILTTLKSVSLIPMRDGLVDLIILGRIPFTEWRITFEPLFLILIITIVGYLVVYAYRQARDKMQDFMWNPEELERISI